MSAREALLALAKRDGFITPESVLTEATNPESELHAHFEWDDEKAAHFGRLTQASNLIRRYKVTIETPDEKRVKVRAFSSVPHGAGKAYVSTEDALADDDQRQFIFEQAMREVATLRAKYQALTDFDAVLRASLGEKVTKRRKAA